MKRIAVLTSGGDAPGMNAAIRAVVRMAVSRGWEVAGIRHGFGGLLQGEVSPLGSRDVGEIMQRGGTVLGSARSPEYDTPEARERALDRLRTERIQALIVIGGNGSQAGAHALSSIGFPVVGIPSTIDNDVYGSDMTIGVDTALNVALEAIDRLKTTASSHRRAFLVEVMGRTCGYLALMSAIAGGAEAVVLPERKTDPEDIALQIREAWERGKAHALIVVAQGAEYNAAKLTEYFDKNRERMGFDLRSTILGYVQRGSEPTYADRMLATRFGAAAVDCIAEGHYGVLVGLKGSDLATTELSDVATRRKTLDNEMLALAEVLAT
jgi:6-phosphofructokinase 1